MADQEKVSETMEAINVAVDSVDNEEELVDTVTLTNGVIVRCKSVSIMTLRYATTNIPRPTPPVVRNEDKSRDEEWEGDPRYQQELMEWEQKVGDVGTNVMLRLGTTIEHIPEDVQRPEDEGWLEMLQASGVKLETETDSGRYLCWLRFYAISTPEDLVAVSTNIAKRSGVLTKDAQASLESFRSRKDGGSDLEAETEELGEHGDPVSNSNGRSHLRTRGEG